VANSNIVVSCAGRTDTAVHASYQVVHFDTPALRTGRNWVKGSNSQLPDSIALLWADEVTESFHARFSATSRTYRYVIHAAPARPAILSQGITWVRNFLNTAAMQEACQHLLGEQDFSAFRGAGCQSLSPNRNITSAKIIQTGELIVFEVTANAFVLHMVRNIIGSRMEVGFGRRDPSWIRQLINGRDRTKSAATASPKGLYLVNVGYPNAPVIPLMPKGPLFLNI
jgi:tRNA pseudouridine38-40 synthase